MQPPAGMPVFCFVMRAVLFVVGSVFLVSTWALLTAVYAVKAVVEQRDLD
jgi:hypothetical protein